MSFRRLAILLAALATGASPVFSEPPAATCPNASLEEALAAQTDLWGEAALCEPDGPSFEFFDRVLPPPRYTNAEFRHYPLMLSAPRGRHKTRVVSNGSGINLRANQRPMWREIAVPVHFGVGERGEPFGSDVRRLSGPVCEDGYLPIFRMHYESGGDRYQQEVFASTIPADADRGAVLTRFRLEQGRQGQVSARLEIAEALKFEDGCLRDDGGRVVLLADAVWQWNEQTKTLIAELRGDAAATLVVYTALPHEPGLRRLETATYEAARRHCADTWNGLLARGVNLDVPEPLIKRMWKTQIIGNFMMASGDRINYSAGNAYDHLYEGECGDAARVLMLYGFLDAGREMVGPLLDFHRKATQYHVSGLKLQLLAHYYWLTRDAAYLRANRTRWMTAVKTILDNREPGSGLVPRENYCGDIARQVYALNSNAQAWRGLRDLAAVLDDIGEQEQARTLAQTARAYREDILRAVEQSERTDVKPAFIPNALFKDEAPYPVLTDTRIGGYYDLMAPYIIGSEVLGPGSPRETAMLEYLQQHGGVCMGMVRTRPDRGQYAGQHGVVMLYSLRYALAQMRRGERESALVTFYGGLAQALTRDTFVGGEATRFPSSDPLARTIYLPPNSTSNATTLWLLRCMLVQDWDLDDDGRPETLRLLEGIPRRWLRDGSRIRLEKAPTAFGMVSLEAHARLREGRVDLRITLSERAPDRVLVRLPLPNGWRVESARLAGAELPVSDSVIDLTGWQGEVSVAFRVKEANN